MLTSPKVYFSPDIPEEARGWRNNWLIWRWCRQNSLISVAEHQAWLERIKTDPSIKMFGICAPTGMIVGVCGFTSINRVNQTAEFSLYIATQHQRKGYGIDALRLLISHGFQDQNFNRIWGESFDGNPATTMFERAGMKKEGTLRQSYFREGRFIDSHIYSILRSEYAGSFFVSRNSGVSDRDLNPNGPATQD